MSDDDGLSDDDMLQEECGRWVNGRLDKLCSKAGSEECDWLCPLNGARADPRPRGRAAR